ncbi:PAQR family membrane homeostasis protein TrhA [Pelagibacterium xiamenense]|uniref:PAQR family membrane homeostasis protein TrhA n=1 Tax=Pelagibacterium xiamenense TaxID=2901140 RepID=UPI001E5A7AD4|nr:hemolysin III family protein [Pelagibacterium xiamenense]MCD7059465.1 hemolysin III family protein [Pelagibacterium xiamenense]
MTKVGQRARDFLRTRRTYSLAELIADGVVHGIGLVMAMVAGSVLLTLALVRTAPEVFVPLAVYVGSLIGVLSVSLAFNLWPEGRVKAWLARFDQAAIFLFIAGTYTPVLASAGDAPMADKLLIFVWAGALLGVALKLLVPKRFGRAAIIVYLAMGWSGVVAFQTLTATLPPTALWLILAGGIAYSAGIIFHLWERLAFQNVLWHIFVVLGASLHLVAMYDFAVISRL